MKIHRSILISSVVVLASRIYEISCGTPASLLKHEESSISTNLPTIQVSGENVVSARSVSSTEKSANATEKRPEKVNLVEEKQQQTPKNVTTRGNKNETQEKGRGLLNDKKNLKPKRKSQHLMDSISAEASTSGATLLHDEGGSSSGSSSKEDVPRQTPKPAMKIGAGSEQGRKEDGQKMAAIVPAVRSLFEDVTTQNSEGMGNVEKKVRAVMAHMKNLSSGRREALLPYFDRFVTKILRKFETRDDAELEEVEELLDRCLSSRCCNNCCSCQGRRRRRKMKQISQIVNGSRRKSPRADDDVSDEKSTKKGRELGTSSGSTSAATTTSLKTTRTTTTTPKPDTTVPTTTKSLGPNKQVQAERMSKLRKRLRKRPLVSRRTMEENGTVRKQKCIRQRPALEQQQQQQQSDKERTARPSHRSNFDQDDFEIPTGIKTRFNDETSDSFEENDS